MKSKAESVPFHRYKQHKAGCTINRTIPAMLMYIFGFYLQAYSQDINVERSVKNAQIAWESIFPGQKCVLLHKSPAGYLTNVYAMRFFKCKIKKTNSRVNPYKLTVRVDIEKWASREKKMSIQDALANEEEKGDRLPGSGTTNFPLTGVYELENGGWLFTFGNKWMINFLKLARAKYNGHVDISKIISIPENDDMASD